MKSYLVAIFSVFSIGLQAAQFQHKISITPVPVTESGQKEYTAEVVIIKQEDEQTNPFVVYSEKLTCLEGEATERTESPEPFDRVVIRIVIPSNHENKAQASLFLQEKNEVVLETKNEPVKIKQLRVLRHWSDRRQQLLEETQE